MCIWYVGGQLAETGVARECAAQLQFARGELAAVLPWIDFSGVAWATLEIDRAEGLQPTGGRPDTPVLTSVDRVIVAWPTKLAMAPRLAQWIETQLLAEGVQPMPGELPDIPQWPRPELASYPWDGELQWN